MKISNLILIMALCFNSFGYSSNESDTTSRLGFNLQSIHGDFTSLIYVNDLSISADFEFYKTYLQRFGIQLGYSYLSAGGVGGSEYGSPFNDLNALFYTSIGYDKLITSQLSIGYTYRMSSKSYVEEYPAGGLKAGISFILNLSKAIKLYARYSGVLNSTNFGASAIGLGLSIGWAK